MYLYVTQQMHQQKSSHVVIRKVMNLVLHNLFDGVLIYKVFVFLHHPPSRYQYLRQMIKTGKREQYPVLQLFDFR